MFHSWFYPISFQKVSKLLADYPKKVARDKTQMPSPQYGSTSSIHPVSCCGNTKSRGSGNLEFPGLLLYACTCCSWRNVVVWPRGKMAKMLMQEVKRKMIGVSKNKSFLMRLLIIAA